MITTVRHLELEQAHVTGDSVTWNLKKSLVEAYFSQYIHRGGTIKMFQAEKFMEQNPQVKRIPKQIQDKVRKLDQDIVILQLHLALAWHTSIMLIVRSSIQPN